MCILDIQGAGKFGQDIERESFGCSNKSKARKECLTSSLV